jgi:uncharacterized membrane protein YphA (DoxX/SURF4 family)
VSTRALFGLGKPAKVEAPKKSKFGSKKKAAKQPEDEEGFMISDEVQDTANEAVFLFIRLFAASMMLHHGQEKILSAELFTKFALDKYFAFLPPIGGSRIIYTYSAGAVQGIAPLFLSLGVFSRLAAAGFASTMLGATFYSLVSTGLEGFPLSKMADKVPVFHNYNFETPLLYISVCVLIAASGPGKFSVAQALGWNDDNTLLGKIKQ